LNHGGSFLEASFLPPFSRAGKKIIMAYRFININAVTKELVSISILDFFDFIRIYKKRELTKLHPRQIRSLPPKIIKNQARGRLP